MSDKTIDRLTERAEIVEELLRACMTALPYLESKALYYPGGDADEAAALIRTAIAKAEGLK